MMGMLAAIALITFFRKHVTQILELTCFLVRTFPVRNLIYRAISSLRPKQNKNVF